MSGAATLLRGKWGQLRSVTRYQWAKTSWHASGPTEKFRSAWHEANLPGGTGQPLGTATSRATMADAVACYRLLLGREPDREGIDHYRQRVSEGLSVGELVGEFLGSVEFVRAHLGAQRRDGTTSEVVTSSFGFRICVDPSDFAVGHTVARTATYEPEVSHTLRRYLHAGETFIDIGANIGWFSLLAAATVGPEGTVAAIEPNPSNTALLRRSAKENGFDNIEIFEVALSSGPGAAALETDGSNGRVIPVEGPPPSPVQASFVVALQPLDAVLSGAGITRADVMKLDVEGAEPLVLRGAIGTITRERPVLVSEIYPLALDSAPWGSAKGYLGQLRELGYVLSIISPGDGAPRAQGDDEILDAAGESGQVNILALPAQ